MLKRSLLCLLPSLLAACGPLAGQAPQLAVSPAVVYFPASAEGGAVSRPLSLYNLGGGPLQVLQLQLAVSTGYELQAPALPRTLGPGEALEVRLIYRPAPGIPATNSVEIESDNPTQRWTRVELAGLTGAAVLTATPPLIDFGAVQSGSTGLRRISVSNLGLATAREVSLDWLEPHADFTARLLLVDAATGAETSVAVGATTELVSGGRAEVTVNYTPRGGDGDRALLRLRWDGGAELLALRGQQDLKAPD